MRMDITTTGASEVSAMLKHIAERMIDPTPAWTPLTGQLIAAQKRLWASHRGWPELKDSTKQRKARSKDAETRAHASTPLHATGALAKFLTSREAELRADRNGYVFGIPGGRNTVFYGRFQTSRGRDPLVSSEVVRRWAGRELMTFIAGSR